MFIHHIAAVSEKVSESVGAWQSSGPVRREVRPWHTLPRRLRLLPTPAGAGRHIRSSRGAADTSGCLCGHFRSLLQSLPEGTSGCLCGYFRSSLQSLPVDSSASAAQSLSSAEDGLGRHGQQGEQGGQEERRRLAESAGRGRRRRSHVAACNTESTHNLLKPQPIRLSRAGRAWRPGGRQPPACRARRRSVQPTLARSGATARAERVDATQRYATLTFDEHHLPHGALGEEVVRAGGLVPAALVADLHDGLVVGGGLQPGQQHPRHRLGPLAALVHPVVHARASHLQAESRDQRGGGGGCAGAKLAPSWRAGRTRSAAGLRRRSALVPPEWR